MYELESFPRWDFFRRFLPVAEVQCVAQLDHQHYLAPEKQVEISGNMKKRWNTSRLTKEFIPAQLVDVGWHI